jgi:hypothetical protein
MIYGAPPPSYAAPHLIYAAPRLGKYDVLTFALAVLYRGILAEDMYLDDV